mmetsp:Transcript_91978/g.249585  ORF Transcript_91978/g.249585 Transcript_91978/m.249585 type:complete len:365 (-) Transcript_91978:119-1213(-)
MLVLQHGLEVVPVALWAARLDRGPGPGDLPLRPGAAVQQERLPALLLLPAVEGGVEVPPALVRPLGPVVLGLEVALGAASRAPGRTAADALPAVRLLPGELLLHPLLHRLLRLAHVCAVPPELHARELHELLQVVQRPVGLRREGRQAGAEHAGDCLVRKILAGCPQVPRQPVHGHVPLAGPRALAAGPPQEALHAILRQAQAAPEVALEFLAVLVNESLLELLPLLVELHEEVLGGIDCVHDHVPPVPLREGALDGKLTSVARIGEDVRHVGNNLLCHAPDCSTEMLIKGVHECLRPYLRAVHLALAAVHARLNFPELLLLLVHDFSDPGLEILLLNLVAILHGRPGDLAEHAVDESGAQAVK